MRTNRGVLLTAIAGLLLAGPLAAQQFENVPEAKPQAPAPAGVNVGVLNLQAAVYATQEGKKALEDLRAHFIPRRAELEKLQREVGDLESQLRTQERTLNDEARYQLSRQIEQKRKLGTRLEQDYQDDAEAAQADLVNRIGAKMQAVIDQYAREKNLGVILNAFQGGPVIYATQAVDITEEVVHLYDQTYPVEKAASATPPAGSSPAPAPARPSRPQQPASQPPK